jgi:hypothetical protein
MGHRRTSKANADLDEIWYFIPTQSGSVEIADRFVDTLTERFYMLR